MDLKEWKDLWVFIEQEDGVAKGVGLELLNEAKRMAGECGQSVYAVVIGDKPDAAVKEAAEYGADKIILVDSPQYAHYNSDAYGKCMIELIKNTNRPPSSSVRPSTVVTWARKWQALCIPA